MNSKIRKIILKKNKTKIVSLTAYSKNVAEVLDKYCDIILVGDSMANVLYAQKTTHEISMNNIIQHSLSVRKGIRKSLLVVDMPKDTYRNSKEAIKNAKLLFKKTKCDAVKLESHKKNFKIVKDLVSKKMPVMGHIGYTPQFKKKFRLEGLNQKEVKNLLNEAKLIEEAGAFSIVLECLTPKAAKYISNNIKIPTIGIGSSSYCDGQILVTDDMLGLSGFYPKFVKKYTDLKKIIEKATKKYVREVRLEKFPTKKNFLNGTKLK